MRQKFFVYFAALVVVQMIICNYVNLTPYVMFSILPVLIFCIPNRISTLTAMLIAFGTGLVVDIFAEGVVGLNALALVPIAFGREWLCRFVFGAELLDRDDDFSVRKYGISKVIFALAIVQAVFLLIYFIADGAASRDIMFNVERFAASLILGTAVSFFIADALSPER